MCSLPSDESPFSSHSMQAPGPPSQIVAPLFTHATPQERFAAVMRRMNPSAAPDLRPAALMVGPAGTQPLDGHFAGQSLNLGPGARSPPTGPAALRARPGLATIAPPAQQMSKFNTGYGDGGTGTGPTLPDNQAQPTTWLSYECQRRHFNPEFKITMLDNGRYKCNIVVRDVVVEAGGSFEIIQDAKNHTAVKAHKIVQKWPSVGNRPRAGSLAVNPVQKRETRQREAEQEKGGFQPEPSSGVDMADPVQARAFVEGYRMGQLAAVGEANVSLSGENEFRRVRLRRRSRSRSPKRSRIDPNHRSSQSSSRNFTSGSKRRRQKSPPRYHDGSRHHPSLPSTDRYRPGPQGKEEDGYGRLREDDFFNGC